MPGPITNVVFVVTWPVDQRDAERFGFARMAAYGLGVQVLDLCAWHSPRPRAAYGVLAPWTGAGLQLISSAAEFEAAIARWAPTSVAFVPNLSVATAPIFQILAKHAVRYCTMKCGLLPEPFGRTAPWWMRLRNHVAHLRRPRLWPQLAAERACQRWGRGYLPAMVMVGGLDGVQRYVAEYGPAIAARILPGHALDYDNYLRVKALPPSSAAPYCVFLDSFEPYHPDYTTNGIRPVAADPYFASLRQFIATIEARTGLPCVIAAHPRSDYAPADLRFGGRPLWRGKTPELVRDARLVLVNASTSINLAILSRLPLLFFLTGPQQRHVAALYARAQARALRLPVLNCDDAAAVARYDYARLQRPVDEAAYRHYQEQYICHPASPPDMLLWDIFYRALTTLGHQ